MRASHSLTDWQTRIGTSVFADTLFQLHRLDQSASLYQDIIASIEQNSHQNPLEFAEALANLALIESLRGETQLAEAKIAQVKEICQNARDANEPATLAIQAVISETLVNLGHWSEAQALLENAYEERTSKFGSTDESTVAALFDLALFRTIVPSTDFQDLSFATSAAATCLRANPTKRNYRFLQALVDLKIGNFDEAIKNIQLLRQLPGDQVFPVDAFVIAMSYWECGDSDKGDHEYAMATSLANQIQHPPLLLRVIQEAADSKFAERQSKGNDIDTDTESSDGGS
jgi:tetratricopeptide (TPR) repeat protein